MGNFQGGGNRGGGGFRGGNGGAGRPSFQKKSWGSDRSEVTMHKAVCSECGKSCEVPFRPSGDKPVYCNDCFGNKKESGDRAPRREFNDRPAPRANFERPTPPNDGIGKQLAEISSKLDRLTQAIEKLTLSKPEVNKQEVKKTASLKTVIKKAVKTQATKAKIVAKKRK